MCCLYRPILFKIRIFMQFLHFHLSVTLDILISYQFTLRHMAKLELIFKLRWGNQERYFYYNILNYELSNDITMMFVFFVCLSFYYIIHIRNGKLFEIWIFHFGGFWWKIVCSNNNLYCYQNLIQKKRVYLLFIQDLQFLTNLCFCDV